MTMRMTPTKRPAIGVPGQARDALAQAAAGEELEILAQEIEREEKQPEAGEDGSRGQHGSWDSRMSWRASVSLARMSRMATKPEIWKTSSNQVPQSEDPHPAGFAAHSLGGGQENMEAGARHVAHAAHVDQQQFDAPVENAGQRLFELWGSRRIETALRSNDGQAVFVDDFNVHRLPFRRTGGSDTARVGYPRNRPTGKVYSGQHRAGSGIRPVAIRTRCGAGRSRPGAARRR